MGDANWCCFIREDGRRCDNPPRWSICIPEPDRPKYDCYTHSCGEHFEAMGGLEGEAVPIERERELLFGDPATIGALDAIVSAQREGIEPTDEQMEFVRDTLAKARGMK